MDEILHLAIGLHDEGLYSVHALTSMSSLLVRTTGRLKLHVLHDSSFGDWRRELFVKLVSHFGQEVQFHDLEGFTRPFSGLENLRLFTSGTLFKLFIPTLLPDEKVLYLDCDTISLCDVHASLAQYWVQQNLPLFAARDDFARQENVKAWIESLGLDPASYFNAGVLLFNNSLINRAYPDWLDRIYTIARAHPELQFLDQDILNLLFADSEKRGRLPARFNFQLGYEKRPLYLPSQLEGKLLHYTWHKPWQEKFPAALPYWQEKERMCAILGLEQAEWRQ